MKSTMAATSLAIVLALGLTVGSAWAGTTEVKLVEQQEIFDAEARSPIKYEGTIAIESNMRLCLTMRSVATRGVLDGLARNNAAYRTWVSGYSAVISATRSTGERVVFTHTCVPSER